ncbi:MAG: FAD-dependent oxidoreductase, partial [Chloroflexota bacterium]
MNDPLSRRQFIQLSAAAAASILITNCASNPSSQKILVIGAGMAGLAAGRTLQDAGYSVTILEGRDRIGGRVWTSKLWPDAPMDMGASWIHGIRRNPMTTLADEINAPRLETDYDNGIIYGADGDLLGDRAWAKYEGYYADIQTAIRRAARQDEDVSIEQAVQDYFDLVSMTAQDRQHLEHVLNSALEQEWSGSVSQLSAQNIEDGTGFGGPDVI